MGLWGETVIFHYARAEETGGGAGGRLRNYQSGLTLITFNEFSPACTEQKTSLSSKVSQETRTPKTTALILKADLVALWI